MANPSDGGICQCPKCGRMHRRLGKPPWRNRTMEIITDARRTGAITFDDINELVRLLDDRIEE